MTKQFVAAVLLLNLCLVGGAHAEIDLEALDRVPALQFSVVRGSANSCGAGCNAWIAAEGRFDVGTPNRFRRLLDQIGDTRLPIFFNSPGGHVYAALELGRMLRARTMTAGVGIALPQSCWTTGNLKECRKLMQASPNLPAMLWSKDVRCASACAFALLGATRREIAAEASLGVHPTTIDTRKLQGSEDEKSRHITAYLRYADGFLPAYFSEMGIKRGLYDIMKGTKLEQMHRLTRSELYGLGIDRRERVESSWIMAHVEFAANGLAAIKNITTKTPAEGLQFEHLALAVSCDYRPQQYVLSILRYFPDTTPEVPVDIVVGTNSDSVSLTAKSAYLETYSAESIEVRQSKLSKDAIEKLLGALKIDVVESRELIDAAQGPFNRFSISTEGAHEVFKAIGTSCPISNPQ